MRLYEEIILVFLTKGKSEVMLEFLFKHRSKLGHDLCKIWQTTDMSCRRLLFYREWFLVCVSVHSYNYLTKKRFQVCVHVGNIV